MEFYTAVLHTRIALGIVRCRTLGAEKMASSKGANATWFGRLVARFIDWRARRNAKLKKRRDDRVRRIVAKEIREREETEAAAAPAAAEVRSLGSRRPRPARA